MPIVLFAALANATAGAEAIPSLERTVRLSAARVNFRVEVLEHGFDSPRAAALRQEIAVLEKAAPAAEATVEATGSAPTTPPEQSSEHMIESLQNPTSYSYDANMKNPCGPYAVAAVLQSYGKPADFGEVYNAVAPSHNIGTGPHELESYMVSHGLSVADRNNGSLDDVAAAVDRGERVIMLVNAVDPPQLNDGHWIAVKGYRVIDGHRYWLTVDSYFDTSGDYNPGGLYPNGIPEEQMARYWSGAVPGPYGAISGYHNYWIDVTDKPPSLLDRLSVGIYGPNSTSSDEVMMSGVRDATRGFDDTFGSGRTVGQRLGGFFTMVEGGAFKVGLGMIPYAVAGAGHVVRDAGNAMRSWGAREWRDGGLFGKVAGAGATVLGALTQGVGWALNLVGTAGSILMGLAGGIVGTAGRALGGAVDGVTHAIGKLL